MDAVLQAERKLYGVSLILAPLLLAVATFFWQDGAIGMVGGTIQVYAYLFWLPAMLGLLSLLRPTMPNFAVWGVLLVTWVCLAGNNFGMQGIYEASFGQAGADEAQLAAANGAMGVAGVLVLYLPGLLFPLTLVLLGILLWRKRAVSPILAVLLCVGALAFPASRIPRIDLIAHLADLLLLVAAGGIGWQLLQGDVRPVAAPRTVGVGDD